MPDYIFYKKKNIYGKNVKIYRKKNSKKEYVKYKNEMILIKNYKKKMKTIIGGEFKSAKSVAKSVAKLGRDFLSNFDPHDKPMSQIREDMKNNEKNFIRCCSDYEIDEVPSCLGKPSLPQEKIIQCNKLNRHAKEIRIGKNNEKIKKSMAFWKMIEDNERLVQQQRQERLRRAMQYKITDGGNKIKKKNKKIKKKNYKKKSKGGIFFKSLAKKAAETKKQIEACCANSANEFTLNICLNKHNISRVPNALQTLCNANKNYERERLITNRYSENDKKLRFERMLKGVEHRVNPSLYSDENIKRSLRGLPIRD